MIGRATVGIEDMLEEVEEAGAEVLSDGERIYRGEQEGSLNEILTQYAEGFDVGTGPDYDIEAWDDFVDEYTRITRDIYEMILND